MSLWHKPIESVTYDDIDAFCKQQLSEGPRLDYKLDIPNKLEKLVAAFANTLGGLIILGVDADKTTNKPNWPSAIGMAKKPGIEEKITAICRDNIYPPLRPQISPIIDNPHAASMALAVLRIDESVEAPHAVDGLVYERTGSQGSPYPLSHIDRIAHMLKRRDQIEAQRIELVSTELKRASRQLAGMRITLAANAGLNPTSLDSRYIHGIPLRWASVIPVFPWRDLCTPAQCFAAHAVFQTDSSTFTWQTVPGGIFARKKISVGGNGQSAEAMCCSLSTRGHVFAIQCAAEMLHSADPNRQAGRPPNPTPTLNLQWTTDFVSHVFDVAARFFSLPTVERPGHVLLGMGLIDVYDWKMLSQPSIRDIRAGHAFLDDDFDHGIQVSLDEFLTLPDHGAAPLFASLKFGFDL